MKALRNSPLDGIEEVASYPFVKPLFIFLNQFPGQIIQVLLHHVEAWILLTFTKPQCNG